MTSLETNIKFANALIVNLDRWDETTMNETGELAPLLLSIVAITGKVDEGSLYNYLHVANALDAQSDWSDEEAEDAATVFLEEVGNLLSAMRFNDPEDSIEIQMQAIIDLPIPR